MVAPRVEEKIRELPDRPGIYIFKDGRGRLLYVGKAVSLRRRAANYLARPRDPRLETMLSEARDLDWVITDTGTEALLLENNWIKSKKPRYNILLRDDKTYPYLKLTADPWPRIAFTRRIRNDGGEYFGPFIPGGRARKAIKVVQKLFGIRVCRIEIDGTLPRPCLYYDMNRCLGPCVEGLTDGAAYREAVEEARLFLSGRTDRLVRRLRRRMAIASGATEFEEAARLRDLIAEVEDLSERRKLASVAGEDVDVYGVHVEGGNAAVASLVMRGGQVLDRRELFWEHLGDVTREALLSEVVPQIYARTTFIPKEIHLPAPIDAQDTLVEWLSERKGERVYVRMPSRGPKAHRVELACKNAAMAWKRRFRQTGGTPPGAEALRKQLHLMEAPRRIEGFDISTFQGGETVASMVVWEEGTMRKRQYRSFNIRGLDGASDDLFSMRQAVERRARRLIEEGARMPDLILVDGGRGQLNAALEALSSLGVEETPVAGLAKREEEVHLPERPAPLRLPRSDSGLKLLQEIRDEAHRFAVDRHRRRRTKRTLRSRLDDLPGVGPKRKRRLLQRFGSLQAIRDATLEALREELGPTVGRRVFEALRREEAGSAK